MTIFLGVPFTGARATPVYLSTESSYPSGHHPRTWLEEKTKEVKAQRWFRVKTENAVFGWLAEHHLPRELRLNSNKKLATNTRTIREKNPLRSGPLPHANVVANLPRATRIQVIDSEFLNWGQVHVSSTGIVWWPMNPSPSEDHPLNKSVPPTFSIKTAELFSRRIFDMAASPTDASLRFASAKGVFRTEDDRVWTRIDLFKDENHPIAVDNSGNIFIGPYVSNDNGQTFHTWIRWHALLATIKQKYTIPPSRIRIIEIQPESDDSRRLFLNLSLGGGMRARLSTNDRGLTWKTLQ